ncbi:MAG: phosphoenolpyruvate--protein phosphotransferase, partial [Proteobacteria bacterium]|nr:phosphoenolpyruvate--protein phosphotransferase [Pseudomonadota bacterium]
AMYRDEQRRQVAVGAALQLTRDLPARTRDDHDVQLYANIDGATEIDDAVDYGAMGIGLFRTEYLYMGQDTMPDEQKHYDQAVSVLEKLKGKPATIRTFDLGSDKLAGFLEAADLEEANPALGLRSIRLCLSEIGRGLFKSQLRGLLRASAHGPLKIMFPMISGVGELRSAKLELRAEGIAFDDHVKVGIMIEMPSAALTADLLARECDFFSIGTNDLIQYTLAVDRGNEYVSYLYEPLHPSLLRLIAMVAKAATAARIPVTICGEMAGDPMIAPVLVGLGIRELSMSAVSIAEVKATIRAASRSDCERLVHDLMQLATPVEVRALVSAYVLALAPRKGA